MFHFFKSTRSSIVKDVSMGLIVTVILVSSISFVVALKVSQNKAQEYLDTKADEYIIYLKDILTLPIWNYDYETIVAIGQTYLQNEQIASIKISDNRGNILVAIQKPDSTSQTMRQARLYNHEIFIGTVQISLTSSYYSIWNRQLFWYFSFVILVNLVSLIIVSGFLLRWSLKKPLNLLYRFVGSYSGGEQVSVPEKMPYSEFIPLTDTLADMGNEIKLQMEELRKAEINYRGIFENATEGIYQSTIDGTILNANPAFAQILGYDNPDDLISEIFAIGTQHYVNPEERDCFLADLKKNQVIKSFEVQFRRKDKSIIWVSINARTICDNNGNIHHIEGLIQDITERKKTETILQRLSTAVEHVVENIIITDSSGIIKYVNPAFEKTTGFSFQEVYDNKHQILGADDTEKSLYDEMLVVAKKGSVWTNRVKNRKKKGGYLIEDVIVSPIKNPLGYFMGYVSINRDVTEKEKYENQLRQSQKMEAIGTLAGGIAHDFNNILGVIIGCSELAKSSIPKKERAIKDIEQVLRASLRAKSLVSQILAFSRQEEGKKIPLDLSPYVKEIVRFLKATIPKTIDISFHLTSDTGIILADPIQIQQILMNLCTNSSQAIGKKKGKITVSLSNRDYTGQDKIPPGVNPGAYVQLEVTDNGSGIPGDIIDKIFDPFFTTKAVGKGTGLGLSVVHGIIQKHEGFIRAESKPGAGASFKVLFPRLEHADLEISVEKDVPFPRGNESVMLVDDEIDLLNIVERILKSLGYQVYAYHNSDEALSAFRNKPEQFNLIITDQQMSGLTGSELIKKMKPRIPTILFTGFGGKESGEKPEWDTLFNRILLKPLRSSELAFAIRKELDGFNRK